MTDETYERIKAFMREEKRRALPVVGEPVARLEVDRSRANDDVELIPGQPTTLGIVRVSRADGLDLYQRIGEEQVLKA